MQKVAVVILNWNGKKYLEQFLPSIIKHNATYADVVVADNASTDDSVKFLKENYPQIKIVINNQNGGYAKGYNDALKRLDYEYFVLLNSDVEVTANWIEPIIEMMGADKQIAACQPKLLTYSNKNEFEYAGAAGGFIDKYGYPFCRGRIFDSYETDNGQYNDSTEIFWATGACLFVRSSAYKELNGLDEDFFAHMEEIDLCWRLKNKGYKIMYCGNSAVYHVGGGTLNKINAQKTYLNFRNNLILICKNHATEYFYLKILLRMILDGIAGVKFLFNGDIKHTVAVIKAHFSFYKTIKKTLLKRKEMRKNIKTFSRTGIFRKSIVMQYYLYGKKKYSELDKNLF
jgi:GT2 family glycosyltransferase